MKRNLKIHSKKLTWWHIQFTLNNEILFAREVGGKNMKNWPILNIFPQSLPQIVTHQAKCWLTYYPPCHSQHCPALPLPNLPLQIFPTFCFLEHCPFTTACRLSPILAVVSPHLLQIQFVCTHAYDGRAKENNRHFCFCGLCFLSLCDVMDIGIWIRTNIFNHLGWTLSYLCWIFLFFFFFKETDCRSLPFLWSLTIHRILSFRSPQYAFFHFWVNELWILSWGNSTLT